MSSSLNKADDRVKRNADEEQTQKDRILQDLTASLLRVVSGKASRRNSGEQEAMKKAIAAMLKNQKKEKAPKAEKKETQRGRSKSAAPKAVQENGNAELETVPKGKRQTRKREESNEPVEHAPAKRARKGK